MSETLAAEQPHLTTRRVQTRERLLRAATSVFAERGVIGASVEQICEAAGFTRGAFYSNFADKDDLVLALIRQEMDLTYAATQQAVEAMLPDVTGDDIAKPLATALAVFAAAVGDGRAATLARRELLLYAAREPGVRDAYAAYLHESNGQMATLVADSVRLAGREFTVPAEDAIELMTAAHQHAQTTALLADTDVDPRPLRVLLEAITRPVPA